jgi:hypothetical protein
MRDLRTLDGYRDRVTERRFYGGNPLPSKQGVFRIPHPATGVMLICIASTGGDWDHVSVSLKHRCPNWREMSFIKRLFFEDDETAVEYHVRETEHVNNYSTCLHLWRPQTQEIPRPSASMVGVQALGELA